MSRGGAVRRASALGMVGVPAGQMAGSTSAARIVMLGPGPVLSLWGNLPVHWGDLALVLWEGHCNLRTLLHS